jgi:hypothetical protein
MYSLRLHSICRNQIEKVRFCISFVFQLTWKNQLPFEDAVKYEMLHILNHFRYEYYWIFFITDSNWSGDLIHWLEDIRGWYALSNIEVAFEDPDHHFCFVTSLAGERRLDFKRPATLFLAKEQKHQKGGNVILKNADGTPCATFFDPKILTTTIFSKLNAIFHFVAMNEVSNCSVPLTFLIHQLCSNTWRPSSTFCWPWIRGRIILI